MFMGPFAGSFLNPLAGSFLTWVITFAAPSASDDRPR